MPPTTLNPQRIGLHRTVPRLVRDPLRAFESIGRECDGALARLNLGFVRPYLVTHPDQVQQVLRNHDTFRREGMIWRPLRRLEGDGIASEGETWQVSRDILQPLFTARNIESLIGEMAQAVAEGIDLMADKANDGEPIDLVDAMTALVHRVLIRVFFSDRLTFAEAHRLGDAITTAFTSLGSRILLPFVGEGFPLPGDRAFREAVRVVDELIYPRILACRAADSSGDDLVAVLARAVDSHGRPLDDKQIRDDLVSMFIAGTETTALGLAWLWLLLAEYPASVSRLRQEVSEVVGSGPVTEAHVPGLQYARMVLQEALRLYPVGWVIPRSAVRPARLGGTTIEAGSTVLLSPYLTHRLPDFWDQPTVFAPERFTTNREQRRHRYAYYPFGAGVHQCLGNSFFLVEGQLIVAGLLSRFEVDLVGPHSLQPRATITLRPKVRAKLLLKPR